MFQMMRPTETSHISIDCCSCSVGRGAFTQRGDRPMPAIPVTIETKPKAASSMLDDKRLITRVETLAVVDFSTKFVPRISAKRSDNGSS